MLELVSWNHPLSGTPFGEMLDLCLVLAAAAWLLSVLTREYSWVDRLWSICPPCYAVWVAASVDFESARLNLMAVLVSLWGVRLTFNLARKGGYSKGGEDYRWAVLRDRLGPARFQALNITFVAPGQMLLIWLFTSPVHQAWLWSAAPLTAVDGIAAAVFLFLLTGETVADEQMWSFQQDKKHRIQLGRPVTEPFLRTGPYALSRHPSYLCEICIWWTVYLFAVAASQQLVHWTMIGCVLLTALFDGSTRFVESISAAKYPKYRDYQASTPRLVPVRFRRKT